MTDKNPKKVKPPMVVNPKFKSKNQTIDFNLEECIPYDLQQYLGQDMPTYRQATKDEFLNEKFELGVFLSNINTINIITNRPIL